MPTSLASGSFKILTVTFHSPEECSINVLASLLLYRTSHLPRSSEVSPLHVLPPLEVWLERHGWTFPWWHLLYGVSKRSGCPSPCFHSAWWWKPLFSTVLLKYRSLQGFGLMLCFDCGCLLLWCCVNFWTVSCNLFRERRWGENVWSMHCVSCNPDRHFWHRKKYFCGWHKPKIQPSWLEVCTMSLQLMLSSENWNSADPWKCIHLTMFLQCP